MLAGAREIADGLTIPNPYPPGAAEAWISSHAATWEQEEGLDLAIERRHDGVLLGAIGLVIQREHSRAALGYWVGVPYWRHGYATEAGREVVRYAFEELGLNRVYAFHFTRNPASGRVLQKLGMLHEGVRRAHILKGSEYLGDEAYGILRSEHVARPSAPANPSASEERQLGVDLFNEAWRLMESREDDDRMLHAAHASRYHWGEAPECEPANLARGEWQVSRVYVVLDRAEPAIWHAQRCLEHCERAGIGDWDLAYAYEALARAHALAGDGEAEQWKAKARTAGDVIADAEDREHFDEDYLTLP